MSLISNTLLALSMSADAFAASVTKGVPLQRPKISYAAKIGLIFGITETITPIIGWTIGLVASGLISSVDHLIAFVILSVIGAKMIHEGMSNEEKERKESHKITVLILTAIGTSIDAMAVGATLALLGRDILLIAAMIGAATFIMSTIGIMAGHYIGNKGGKIAEILGGLCLIAIGTGIMIEHMTN